MDVTKFAKEKFKVYRSCVLLSDNEDPKHFPFNINSMVEPNNSICDHKSGYQYINKDGKNNLVRKEGVGKR